MFLMFFFNFHTDVFYNYGLYGYQTESNETWSNRNFDESIGIEMCFSGTAQL